MRIYSSFAVLSSFWQLFANPEGPDARQVSVRLLFPNPEYEFCVPFPNPEVCVPLPNPELCVPFPNPEMLEPLRL
jgi:hypothetical protein